jgi:hypothetical protein
MEPRPPAGEHNLKAAANAPSGAVGNGFRNSPRLIDRNPPILPLAIDSPHRPAVVAVPVVVVVVVAARVPAATVITRAARF